MRTLRLVVVALILAASGGASAAPEPADETEADVAECIMACDDAAAACRTAAAVEVEKCREKVATRCDEWCPCTRFIGAAYFACVPECDRCRAESAVIVARCPDGSEAQSACEATQVRCERRCRAGE